LSEPSHGLIQDNDRIFFVSELKTDNISLQVRRAVCVMYLRAKIFKSVAFSSHSHFCNENFAAVRKFVIRGTVTDGCSWIFLVLKMNHDGDGAIYTQTEEPISIVVGARFLRRPEISQLVCDLIAGIISHWVSTFHSPLCHYYLVNLI